MNPGHHGSFSFSASSSVLASGHFTLCRVLAGDLTQHSAFANEVFLWVLFSRKYRILGAPRFGPPPSISLSHGLLQARGHRGPSLPEAISGDSYLRGFTFTSEQPNCACNNGDQLLHNRASQKKQGERAFNMQ